MSRYESIQKAQQQQNLQGRLQHMTVLELRKDGGQDYLDMTQRGLYDYVLKCITHRSKQVISSTDGSVQQQQVGQPSMETITTISHLPSLRVRKPTIFLARNSDPPPATHTEVFLKNNVALSDTCSTRQKQTSQDESLSSSWNRHPPPISMSPSIIIGDRERLGGYLHPRDMRRLVTPFSSSNEPELMVRRHVMLINFDPLRAIVLRDRLLVLVPDGADSILIELQQRIQGYYDDDVGDETTTAGMFDPSNSICMDECNHTHKNVDYDEHSLDIMNEWRSIDGRHFIHVAFELQAVDAVLATISSMLSQDASLLKERIQGIVDEYQRGSAPGDHAQDSFRILKDSIKELQARVSGIVRALNQIVDNDEDMALMNLSRLLTHPQRFIQPVSLAILSEESEDPELIVEAYLQQAVSEYNALNLLRGNIRHTEDQVLLKLDSIRNQILYINNIVSVLGLCLTFAACVASFFGMNLQNRLEISPNAFVITFSTSMILSTAIFAYFMRFINPLR